jgi:hypothetical protein
MSTRRKPQTCRNSLKNTMLYQVHVAISGIQTQNLLIAYVVVNPTTIRCHDITESVESGVKHQNPIPCPLNILTKHLKGVHGNNFHIIYIFCWSPDDHLQCASKHNVVSSTCSHKRDSNSELTNCICSCKSNYHTITYDHDGPFI